jgi:hypothetical protein
MPGSTIKVGHIPANESEYTVTFTEMEMMYLVGLLASIDDPIADKLFVKTDAQLITGRRRDGKVM